MKLSVISDIDHQGEEVVITLRVPAQAFVRFVDGLKKGKLPVVKVKQEVDVKAKKDALYKLIKDFQTSKPGLYPGGLYNAFYVYWGEVSKTQKSIRYEKEKYFDIAKRLATFKARCSPEEMGKWWEEDSIKKTAHKQSQTLFT